MLIFLASCAKPVDEDRGYSQSQVSVKFRESVSKEEAYSILGSFKLKIINEQGSIFRVEVPKGIVVSEIEKKLESLSQVEYVSLIREYQIVL